MINAASSMAEMLPHQGNMLVAFSVVTIPFGNGACDREGSNNSYQNDGG